MTLIELFWFVLWIFFGALGSTWAYRRYGWTGGIVGFVGGVLAMPAVLYPLAYLVEMIYVGKPGYPVCRTGKCQYVDYRFRRQDNGEYALFCQCGARYQKCGRHFSEVLPDGSVHPYMVWRAFKGWFPENQ
ncbi:MAG TPA: hypothetical protein VFQ18_01520 [Candidatus Acidoferrum sp.]|nr:hypothetical protein [Candidatus Acidoferrum sp.]